MRYLRVDPGPVLPPRLQVPPPPRHDRRGQVEGVAPPRALRPSPEKRLLRPQAQQIGLWKVVHLWRQQPSKETGEVEKY